MLGLRAELEKYRRHRDLARDKDVSVGEGAYGVSELLKIKKKKKNANKQTQHLQVTALRLRKCNTTML